MDVLTELLTPSYSVKSESTAKDRKQKNKGYSQTRHKYPANNSENPSDIIDIRTASNWGEVERRSGRDRREQMEGRGRWLESRDRNDRRTTRLAISVKI